jgi:hypothetical protein
VKPSANQSAEGHTRKRFALTGRSRPIDPRHDAARADLADVRLADRVFAPHYAAPLIRVVRTATALRAASAADAEILTRLSPGDVFEVLEFAGTSAWGTAPGPKLVGYIDAQALNDGQP